MPKNNTMITCNVFFRGDVGLKSALKKIFESNNLIFSEITSYLELEEITEPIIYFNFSEDELGFYESKYLDRRKEKNLDTFIVLFFSEEFFHLLEGEIPSYTTLIDSYSHISSFPVIAFRNEEIIEDSYNFKNYIEIIKNFFDSYEIRKNNNYLIEQLTSFIYNIHSKNIEDTLYLLLLSNFTKEIKRKIDELEEENKRLKKSVTSLSGAIQDIQEKNEKEAVKKYHFYKYEKPSENALINKITLKYGKIFGNIKQFLEHIESDQIIYQDGEVKIKCKDTRTLLDKVCTMAVLGTFSSGKTTFINSLIMSQHKLRTSQAHNSAVLVKIQNAPEQEFYEVEYRTDIELDILKSTEYDDIAQIYEGNAELKVIHIDNENNLIQARNSKSQLVDLRIEPEKTISIKKGDILTKGTKLTEGFIHVHDNDEQYKIKCISKNDIKSIIKQIETHSLYDFNLELIKYNNNNKLIYENNCLDTLKYFEKHFNEADAHLTSDILNTNLLEKTIKVVFHGKYKKDDEKILLNNQNAWNTFCENKNGQIFIESPECYIFAKEVRLFMKSSFLENCKIVDTPGFGSVTESHDAISERYLRDHRGIMLIMVKIDIHANSNAFRLLITDINQIEKTGSNLKKEKIYFILNCFRNNLTDEALKRKCEEINKVLITEGFNKNNIYVCNIKSSLGNGEYLKTLYGFPSYENFRIKLLKEIENEGQLMQLDQIRNSWNNYLNTKISSARKSLETKQESEKIRKQKYDEVSEKLANVKKITFYSFEKFEREIRDKFDDLTDRILNTENKKEFKQAYEEIKNFLETICINIYNDDSISDYYTFAAGEIKLFTDGQVEIIPESEQKHFIFPAVKVENVYKTTMKEGWGLFFLKKKEKLSGVTSFINKELNNSLENYKNYYNFVIDRLNIIKDSVVYTLEKEQNSYKDNHSLLQSISETERLIDSLERLLAKYKIISEEIDTYFFVQKEL